MGGDSNTVVRLQVDPLSLVPKSFVICGCAPHPVPQIWCQIRGRFVGFELRRSLIDTRRRVLIKADTSESMKEQHAEYCWHLEKKPNHRPELKHESKQLTRPFDPLGTENVSELMTFSTIH